MKAIEIVVIVVIAIILLAIIIGGFVRRAKAKKNGTPSCGCCASCRHASSCSSMNSDEVTDSDLSIVEEGKKDIDSDNPASISKENIIDIEPEDDLINNK